MSDSQSPKDLKIDIKEREQSNEAEENSVDSAEEKQQSNGHPKSLGTLKTLTLIDKR